jgi:hypothetical protein
MLCLTVSTLLVLFIIQQTEAEEAVEHGELSTVYTINVKATKTNLPAYEISITDCKSAGRI